MSPTQFFLKYQMNLQLLMVPRLLCAPAYPKQLDTISVERPEGQ